MSETVIRVVILDPHVLTRRAMVSLLGQEPDIQVVGEVGETQETGKVLADKHPDILLMDLDSACRTRDYTPLLEHVRSAHPSVRVVVMTDHTERECRILNPPPPGWTNSGPETCCLHKAFRAGVRGAVRKTAPPAELRRVLHEVVQGHYAFEKQVETQVLHSLLGREPRPVVPQLTTRERQILGLLVQGRSNKQIGRALGIQEQTVKNHVSRMLEKTELEDRVQLAIHAVRDSLLGMDLPS